MRDASVDGRDTEIRRGGHWSSDAVLGQRATFQWPANASSESSLPSKVVGEAATAGLLLSPITESDQSAYRCRLDYKEAQTRNLLISLSIIGEFIDG